MDGGSGSEARDLPDLAAAPHLVQGDSKCPLGIYRVPHSSLCVIQTKILEEGTVIPILQMNKLRHRKFA